MIARRIALVALAAMLLATCRPAGRQFETAFTNENPYWSASVILGDLTDLVVAVEPGQGDLFHSDLEVTADPANPSVLVVQWDGGSCTDEILLSFGRTTTGFALRLEGRMPFMGSCGGVGLARTLRITTSEPIDPATIVLSGQE